MAQNPWEMDWSAPQAAPASGPPPFIPGSVSPSKQAADQRATNADARAASAEARAAAEYAATHNPDGTKKETADKLQTISSAAAGGIQENLKTLNAVKDALGLLDHRPESVGPGTGFFGDTFTQFNDPNGTATRSSVGRVGAYKIHDLSGAAVSATEAPRFSPFVPTVTDRPEVARQKLEGFQKELEAQIREQLDFYSPANGYRPYTTPGAEAFQTQASGQSVPVDKPPQFVAPTGPAGEYNPNDPTQRPVAGGGLDNGGGGQQAIVPVGQTTRREDDPNLVAKGVRAEYRARLMRGDSADSIIEWANSVGIHPGASPSIRAQVDYRRKHPNVPINQYGTDQLDDRIIPLSAMDQMTNAAGQSDLGAAAIAAGDAASAYTLDNIIGATGGNAERARLGMNQVAAEHPKSSLAGTIVGGTSAALAAEAGLASAGMRAGAARTLAADIGYGGAAGAGGTDYNALGGPASLSDRSLGAGKGALAAAVGSTVGNALSGAARGVANTSVNALRDAGVPVTVGQAFGQSGRIGAAVKGVEDRLSGLPVVGDMVNARRAEGYTAFNSGAFNKALEPIGGAIGDKVGEEAVDLAQQQVSDAFQTALAGKAVQADKRFAVDLTRAISKARTITKIGDDVAQDIGDILQPYMQGQSLTGEAMQQISRDLRALKAGYAKDTRARVVGKAIDATEDAVFGMFQRQAPEVLPAYNAAKQAQRRVYILADAVNKGKNTGGVFTPAQLGIADRTNAKQYGGTMNAARGKSEFHDYQRAAQDILPSKVPDSGSAGRWLVPAALLSGGAASDYYAGTDGKGLALATALSLAYSKAGQRALTKPARGASTKVGKALGGETARKALGASLGSSAAALTTQ